MQREYDFITGPETSTLPTVSDPSGAGDTVNLGYLNNRSYWGAAVSDYAAIRALTSTQRSDRQVRMVDIASPELWQFDAASTGTDDGATILKPSDLSAPDPGRWLILSSGGGSGGGSTSGVETLMQKLEAEKYHVISEPLDNSTGISGVFSETQKLITGTLLQSQVSTDTTLEIVWNAQAVSTSDQNMDATTGWTATGQAGSLTASSTAGDFKVGTAGLKFNKAGAGTEAAIRFDNGSQIRQYNASSRVWVYCYLPSITSLTNILLRIYADSTSNFQTFTVTTQFNGSALAVGWNLLLFDISTGGSASGTGWDISKLSRYTELGVTTSIAGQTYTGVIFDACYFSYYRPQDLGVIANEFTLFNNSTQEDVIIDSTNTLSDGRLTLASALGNNYSGGLTDTARARVYRSTLAMIGDSQIPFDNDATFSGAITTSQDFRIASYARGAVSGSALAIIDMIGVQSYIVTTVGGSTIGVEDAVDQHLNLLSGDTMDIFRVLSIGGKNYYTLRASRALSANSSFSSGTTTLTLTTTGIVPGDIVVKRHLTQLAASVVNEGVNETFSSMSALSSPDGIQLIDNGLKYPNPESLVGHYFLGSVSQADALRNRAIGAQTPAMTVTGTVNNGGAFQKGRFSLLGNASDTTNFAAIPSSASNLDASANKVQYSFWFYYDGTLGSNRALITRVNGAGNNGYYIYIGSGASVLSLQVNTTSIASAGAPIVGWNHIILVLNDSGVNYLVLNGVKSSTISVTPGNPGQPVTMIAGGTLTGYFGTNLRAADLLVWVNGSTLTSGQIQSIYNAGIFREVGFGPMWRASYATNGVSGQKLSLRGKFSRSTTAVTPNVWKAGMIIG